jgi:S-adenosylhomocysteine hydrolase
MGVSEKNIFHGNNYKLSWKFTQYQIARVRNVTTILRNRLKKEDRLMVIDDNQFFLDALSTTATPWVNPLVLVEPTQRGIAKLRDKLALQSLCQKFPVANSGYSVGKLEVEVPHIAEVNAKALVARITALGIKPESDVIVLGYGSIGRAATSSLKKLGFGSVMVTCLDKLNVADAVKDGYPIWDRANMKDKKFDLVIGCSDSSSWKQEDHIHLKDNAILLSLTHGSQELSIEDYLEIGTQKIQVLDKVLRGMNMLNKEILETQKYHEDIPFQLGDGRKITFLNAGFPLAFPGYRGEYPTFSDLKMQPGMAAVIAGALQAHSWYGNLPKGAVPLDPEFDQWVMPAYRQIEKNWKGN